MLGYQRSQLKWRCKESKKIHVTMEDFTHWVRHVHSPSANLNKIEEYSIEVHTSRRPLDRLTLTLTFDLWPNIHWWAIVMDNLCAKFGDFSFSRFSFIAQNRQADRGGWLLAYTHATIPSTWVIRKKTPKIFSVFYELPGAAGNSLSRAPLW